MSETISGIELDKNTRLSLLRRVREILSDRARWGTSYLRDELNGTYCLLGACERAAYDLGYATEDQENSFDESDWGDSGEPLGYVLAKDLSLNTYAKERYSGQQIEAAFQVNDRLGYDETMSFLDSYLAEVERGRPRSAET